MSIPTTIESLSVTASSNGPAGTDDRSTADDGLRQAYAFIKQSVSLGSNIASASTVTPPSTGNVFNITGTTSITTIASTNSWDGRIVTFIFAGALTLTHSSNLALPGSANITTAANDIATFVQTASGAWRLAKYTASSGALIGTTGTFTGNLLQTGTGSVGYGTGSGGSVTQITSKSTTVILNKSTGVITMDSAALAAGASVIFQLTNSFIVGTDTVTAVLGSATPTFGYILSIQAFNGGCFFYLKNDTAGSLSEAVTINFSVIKAVTS